MSATDLVKLKLSTVPSATPYNGTAVLEKVVDGDTIHVRVRGRYRNGVFYFTDMDGIPYAIAEDNLYAKRPSRKLVYIISVRLIGVDSYETNSPNPAERRAAEQATTILEKTLNSDPGPILVLYGLEAPNRSKGRRLVGDVYYQGGVSYVELMRGNFPLLWPPYKGEKRQLFVPGSIRKV